MVHRVLWNPEGEFRGAASKTEIDIAYLGSYSSRRAGEPSRTLRSLCTQKQIDLKLRGRKVA